jgi:tRNA (guanine37-N1)-methyltransferase
MKLGFVSLFPDLLRAFMTTSLVGKACEKGLLEAFFQNPRDFASPPHFHVDDTPYGGGPGMVMKPEPLAGAIESLRQEIPTAHVICPSPSGAIFTQEKARDLAALPSLIFVCGRYEGIDERVLRNFVDEEISLGDYVVMGGEIPAMAIVEAVVRLIPGILGNDFSVIEESFSHHSPSLLEAPQYTKPREFQGERIPDVLLSGDHGQIARWRKEQSDERTRSRRPDLWLRHQKESK